MLGTYVEDATSSPGYVPARGRWPVPAAGPLPWTVVPVTPPAAGPAGPVSRGIGPCVPQPGQPGCPGRWPHAGSDHRLYGSPAGRLLMRD